MGHEALLNTVAHKQLMLLLLTCTGSAQHKNCYARLSTHARQSEAERASPATVSMLRSRALELYVSEPPTSSVAPSTRERGVGRIVLDALSTSCARQRPLSSFLLPYFSCADEACEHR